MKTVFAESSRRGARIWATPRRGPELGDAARPVPVRLLHRRLSRADASPRPERWRVAPPTWRLDLLALGVDPEGRLLFLQRWCRSTPSWRGSSTRHRHGRARADDPVQGQERAPAENVNAGLFTYPVLQAADILLYKAEAVPVGEISSSPSSPTRWSPDGHQPSLDEHGDRAVVEVVVSPAGRSRVELVRIDGVAGRSTSRTTE